MRARTLRRLVRHAGGLAVGLLLAAVVGLVGLPPIDRGQAPTEGAVILVAAIAVWLLVAVARRLRFAAPTARAQRVSRLMAWAAGLADAELAVALVLAGHVIMRLSGGVTSPLAPVVFGTIAFVATFLARSALVAALAVAIGLELALVAPLGLGRAAVPAAIHLGLCGAAALAHALFLRGLVGRERTRRRHQLEHEIARQRESARDYRLIAAALGAESRARRSRGDEEHMLAAGSALVVGSSVYYTLSLLKRALAARTVVLLWLDERGEALKIKEALSDAENLVEERVEIAGAIGAVVRDRALLSLPVTRPGQVSYYQGGDAGAFLAVPVLDGSHLRGVVCADRVEPFDERDADLVLQATHQVMAAIRAEQVFAQVERAKYEHERFYQASAMLGRALTVEQVMATAFDAAGEIVDHDLAVLTLFHKESGKHKVQAVRVPPGREPMCDVDLLAGLEFKDNASLAAMVVKNRHFLPAAGELRDLSVPIFTKKVRPKHLESLLVLPLCQAEEAIGTLTLMSSHKGRFRKDVREMLGVIANQVAVSLQNALMYRQMETMATTDGLTGLTNHRAFQDRFADLLARAGRHGHRAAMLLCDVDHFKKVNDTYGHPVGDEVLRRVARVLMDAVRKIDIPARYGGEEFAVVLESSDLEGALRLAERIRQDVARLEIESDQGSFKVTMSIGVAAFPDDARDQAALIEHADHALYHAKQHGRNRVVSYREFVAARKAKRAS